MDSRCSGVPHGELSDFQLGGEQKLTEVPERYTLLLLPSSLCRQAVAWLDQHSLRQCRGA